MDYIRRERYLKKIEPFVGKPIIKVLTGMRRVGKSSLLALIQQDLLKSLPKQNMLHINLESLEYLSLRSVEALREAVLSAMHGVEGMRYYFFDEVQLVPGWEQLINALHAQGNCDIYVTGSNSTLLSSELSTLLAGRYVEIPVQSFSFAEFVEIYAHLGKSKEALFVDYLELGGMPFLHYFALAKEPSLQYLNELYHSVLLKDVIARYQIRDVDIFQRILDFAIENIGHSFSANSIKKYLQSQMRKVSVDTVLNYLQYCQEAFVLKKIPRYALQGKKVLNIDEKYFLSDVGFRSARGFSASRDIERVLENIVCTELLSRGYTLHVGRVGDKEIDFIAQKDGNISYYQVCYLLQSPETREREFGVYRQVQDNYPKYVLSMDALDFSQDGVVHRNIVNFLMENQ